MGWRCTYQWKSRVCWETRRKTPLKKIFWDEPTNAIARKTWHRVLEVFSFHYDNALKLVMCSLADSQRKTGLSHLGYIKENISLSCWECMTSETKKWMVKVIYIALATFAYSTVAKPFCHSNMQGSDKTRNARPMHLHLGTFRSMLTANAFSIDNI